MRVLLLFILLFSSAGSRAKPATDDSMVKKGIELYLQGDYEQSVEILQARLKSAIADNEKDIQKVIYNNLGNNYADLGNSVEALKAYDKGISIAEEQHDKKSVAKLTKNIGTLYSETKDFEKALAKYDEAEKIGLSVNDTFILADIANNKGVVYEQQLKYPGALASYHKALSLYQELGMQDRIAILYTNLGVVHKYLKNYDSSIFCYEQSQAISEKTGSKFMVAANLINIGNVYEMKGDYKKAIELNEKGLQIGKEINSQELVMEAYDNLAGDYAKDGDYKSAYGLYKTYMATKDSFISVERSKQLADMQARYETVKKEKQIIKLESERLQMMSVIGIMILLAIVTWLLYNRQQVKQRLAREKAVQEAEYNERMRIAKDVHDDLGSGLSKISLTAGVAEQKAMSNVNTAPDIRHIATMSKDLVDNMRDLIWVLNPDNTTLDNLITRLREYCADYLDGFDIEASLAFPADVPPVRISRETQRNIFATVKEAIHNCIKHADATQVNISARIERGKLFVTIADNGKGMDTQNLRSSGNGLRNMRQRIESIGGSFSVESGQGTAIHLSVPVSSVPAAV